jgi:hypothetical protein
LLSAPRTPPVRPPPRSRDPMALLGTAQSSTTKSYIFCIATPHDGVYKTGTAAHCEREMDHYCTWNF